MKKTVFVASLVLPLAMAQAQDKPLSADEVRTLVTGKTLDFAVNASGYGSITALEAGGGGSAAFMNTQNPRGNFSAPVKWQVNDKGELCVHVQRTGFNERCGLVQKAQGGSYERLADGKVDASFKVR